MKSTNAVNISMNVQDIADATDYGLTITGITSSSGILYYEIPVFRARYKVSYSTICRSIERVRERRDARNYFVKVGGKNYVSCGIITNRKKHTAHFENEQYRQWLQYYDKALVFVYATEPNPSGNHGYHNHFLVGYQDDLVYSDVKSFIENYLRAGKEENRARTEVEPYRFEEDYIGYIVSKIEETPDGWDFLTSNFIS